MKRAIPPPTKAESERIRRIVDYGCIVSRIKWRTYAPPDVHHLLDGGRNIGHWFTIPLSPWFHRGVTLSGMSQKEMTRVYGPSLELDKDAFETAFGTDRYLWEVVQRLFKLDRAWPPSKILPRRVA